MTTNKTVTGDPNFLLTATKILFFNDFNNFDKSSARISLHLLPGFEFLKIKSVLYDTDNTPKNVPVNMNMWLIKKVKSAELFIHFLDIKLVKDPALPALTRLTFKEENCK